MKCKEKIGEYCTKAISCKKYTEYRKCDKCCLECNDKCDFICDKALEGDKSGQTA